MPFSLPSTTIPPYHCYCLAYSTMSCCPTGAIIHHTTPIHSDPIFFQPTGLSLCPTLKFFLVHLAIPVLKKPQTSTFQQCAVLRPTPCLHTFTLPLSLTIFCTIYVFFLVRCFYASPQFDHLLFIQCLVYLSHKPKCLFIRLPPWVSSPPWVNSPM